MRTVTGVTPTRRRSAGGQQTGEADGRRHATKRGLFHTVSTSTPSQERAEEAQAAGEHEATRRSFDELVAADGKIGRETRSDDQDVEIEEEEEEYCWSSDSDGEERGGGEVVETVSVEQRARFVCRPHYADYERGEGQMGSCEPTRAIGGGETTSLQESVLARITTLKALCEQGFLSADEYERRKGAIIDELTWSTVQPMVTRRRKSFRRCEGLPMIVPHAPDFRDALPEVATKHVFNYETREWSSMQVYINLDETPFSKGSLRVVYHLQDLGNVDQVESKPSRSRSRAASSTGGRTYVAKLAIDPDEDPQTYFRDIELQAHCAYYAHVYNSYHPPKRVEFIKAWVLELTERDGALCAVEPYMPGEYRKHNNNFGSVSDDERNTPQAFSHFTYEASNHELLAVDIQGVGDLYTDPQIHTLNGNDFGKGNLGVLGFQKFLSSHRCNSICRYFKLPPVNPKERQADSGTLPVQELMNRDRVRPTHFDSKHYYENAPMLQKYVAHCRELEHRRHDAPRRRMSLWELVLSWFCGC